MNTISNRNSKKVHQVFLVYFIKKIDFFIIKVIFKFQRILKSYDFDVNLHYKFFR